MSGFFVDSISNPVAHSNSIAQSQLIGYHLDPDHEDTPRFTPRFSRHFRGNGNFSIDMGNEPSREPRRVNIAPPNYQSHDFSLGRDPGRVFLPPAYQEREGISNSEYVEELFKNYQRAAENLAICRGRYEEAQQRYSSSEITSAENQYAEFPHCRRSVNGSRCIMCEDQHSLSVESAYNAAVSAMVVSIDILGICRIMYIIKLLYYFYDEYHVLYNK